MTLSKKEFLSDFFLSSVIYYCYYFLLSQINMFTNPIFPFAYISKLYKLR